MTNEDAINALLARERIDSTLSLYAGSLDKRDRVAFRSCFADRIELKELRWKICRREIDITLQDSAPAAGH